MKTRTRFTKQLAFSAVLFLVLLASQLSVNAASYYWRATAVNNLFTNIGNWETAPGSGISPATAPTPTDDVFFPVSSTQSAIVFNNGNCRDFTFTAPSAFTFTGTLTTLSGNLSCNGNATLGISTATIINFTGTGAKTIDMGTTANVVFAILNFATPGSSYSLLSTFNSYANFNISTASFSTNGKTFSYATFLVTGSTVKTIDFSNSSVTSIRNATTGAGVLTSFSSSGVTTTYNLTGAKLLFQNDFAAANDATPNFSVGAAVSISMDSLTFTSSAAGINKLVVNFGGTAASPSVITANVLKINTGNLNTGDYNAQYVTPNATVATFNVGKILFTRPSAWYNNATVTFNVGSGGITEPASCSRVVIMNNMGKLNYNVTPAVTTTKTDYYGVTFGGGGITAGGNSNIGLNTGTVSFGTTTPGINYWWIGGTGNWNDPTRWSIVGSGGPPQSFSGCIPTLQDNVFFDAASFIGAQTVTIPNGSDAYCKNMDWSAGSNLGLLAGPNSTMASSLIINGSANFTQARGVTAPLIFTGGGTHTISWGSFFTYQSLYVRLQGTGTYTMTDDFKCTPGISTIFQHRAGSFNTAGFKLDVSTFFSSSMPQTVNNLRALTITGSELDIRAASVSIDVSFLTSLNAGGTLIKYITQANPYFEITRTNTSATFLAAANMNDINFNVGGLASFYTTGNTGYTASFHDVSFSGSANIFNQATATHTVNNYNFSSGNTYAFQSGKIFNVISAIGTSSSCGDFFMLNSNTAGSQAKINKATAPFNVNGAVIKDINSIGTTLTVATGQDNGNNINVSVGAATGRTMYWVGNAGNWSDGNNHWSIGVSGGNPATTNPLGCYPRLTDSVVFDNNSFTLASQTVTVDVTASCKGMMWTAGAGAKTPVMSGATTLNDYGCLELAAGMTCPFAGSFVMLGTNTARNSNYIDVNGVKTVASFFLQGGGTYDLLDSITVTYFQGRFNLISGNLYTNGNKISSPFNSYVINSGNTLDISNSILFSNLNGPYQSYIFSHAAGSFFNAAGSTLYSNDGLSIANSTGSPLYYNNVFITSANTAQNWITSTANIVINFKNVYVSGAGGTTLNGTLVMDTLQLAPASINLLTPSGGRSYTVNDTLIAYGTPCIPAYLRSATLGTAAILKSTRCNLDLHYMNVRDINVSTCTAAQNNIKGADEGGNTNWTIGAPGTIIDLGPDTTIWCRNTPYAQVPTGYNYIPGITYMWGDGQTTPSVPVTNNGTYSISVSFAPGCVLNDSRIITVNPTPPISLATGFEQVSPTYCNTGNYNYYEGASATNSDSKALMAINPNGNTITPIIKVNNEGNLTGGTGTFSNTDPGYYQTTDGTNTIRISKRLHSIIAPGSYPVNGGVIVRIYYNAAEMSTMSTDTWPGGAMTANFGWFKQQNHSAQGVLDSLKPGELGGSYPLTPLSVGTVGGVNYAEFKLTSFSTIGFFVSTKTFALLPVKLLAFNVQKTNNNNALLTWQTASEQNSSYFEVQYSDDGINWQSIGQVAAAGNSSALRSYQFIHSNLSNGTNYYRLKLTDTDGRFSFSNVQLLRINDTQTITVLPNPVTDRVFIRSNAAVKNLQLFDVAGRLIWQTNHFTNGGSIDMTGYTNGFYQLKIVTVDGNTEVHKLMKR